jgi:hypothetical protein
MMDVCSRPHTRSSAHDVSFFLIDLGAGRRPLVDGFLRRLGFVLPAARGGAAAALLLDLR